MEDDEGDGTMKDFDYYIFIVGHKFCRRLA